MISSHRSLLLSSPVACLPASRRHQITIRVTSPFRFLLNILQVSSQQLPTL